MSFPRRIAYACLAAFEILLAVLSFLFFKTMKFVVRRLLSLYYRLAVRQGLRWKYASAALLKTPGALPMIMTTGPRWNTHAIIGTAGPFAVERSIAFDTEAAQHSASIWTLVICSYPGYRTVRAISSRDAPFPNPRVEIPLPAGRYWIGLRYYYWTETVDLPGIAIDGRPAIDPVSVPANVNDFYATLAGESKPFYYCLHYYVHVMLRYRAYLPAKFVEREFVPLGNPETRFYFGYIPADGRLSIEVLPEVLKSSDIYITMYNHASFPIASYHVKIPDFLSDPRPGDCVYLIRHQDRTAHGTGSSVEELRISVAGGRHGL